MTRVLSMQCPFGMSDAVFLWLLAAVLVQHHARGYTTEIPRAFSVVTRQLTLVKKTLQSSPNSGMSQTLGDAIQGPVAVDHILYSTDRGRIFFSDKFGKVIASINMDGTDQVDILKVGLVTSLAIDWVGKYIYWLDAMYKRIEVSRLDGSGRKILYQFPQAVLAESKPRGMALHPRIGVMYFTDWGNFPAIMRARMDGLFVSPIVDTDIRWPNSVTVDCETDHIYWIDAYYHRIERADLNGLERRVVLSDVNTIYHGFHLLVKGHHIYWSEWWTKTFYRALLPTGVNSLQTPQELMILDNTTIGYHYGFTIVNASAPRRGELSGSYSMGACALRNGRCTSNHLCVPVSIFDRLCACPNGVQSCIEYYGRSNQPPPPWVFAKATTTTTPAPPAFSASCCSTAVQTTTTSRSAADTTEDGRTATTTSRSAADTTEDGRTATTTSRSAADTTEDGGTSKEAITPVRANQELDDEGSPQYVLSIFETLGIVLIVMIFALLVIIIIITSVCIKKQKKNVYSADGARKTNSNILVWEPEVFILGSHTMETNTSCLPAVIRGVESNTSCPLSGTLPGDPSFPGTVSGLPPPQCSHDAADPRIAIVTKDGEVVLGSGSHSDSDGLLPIKPVGLLSDDDRLLPTATLAPSDDIKLSEDLLEESQC